MIAMGVGDFKMITTMGPGIAVAVASRSLAALTLSPALLSIFGHYLFWPLHTRDEARGRAARLLRAPRERRSRAARASSPSALIAAAARADPLPAAGQAPTSTSSPTCPATPTPGSATSRSATTWARTSSSSRPALIDLGGGGDIARPGPARQAPHAAWTTSRRRRRRHDHQPRDARTATPPSPTASARRRRSARSPTSSRAMAARRRAPTTPASSTPRSRTGSTRPSTTSTVSAVAFPDVGRRRRVARVAATAWRTRIDIVDRVRDAERRRRPSCARCPPRSRPRPPRPRAAPSDDSDSTLMSDYLEELARPTPRSGRSTPTRTPSRPPARSSGRVDRGRARRCRTPSTRLADHFDAQPDATLSPESLADTASAKESSGEAEATFDALPDQFAAWRPSSPAAPTTSTSRRRSTGDEADEAPGRGRCVRLRGPHGDPLLPHVDQRPVLRAAPSDGQGRPRHARRTTPPRSGTARPAHLGGPTAQFADVQDTLGAGLPPGRRDHGARHPASS